MSAVIHEYAHGVAALSLGDTTARDAGRLTLNPIKHLHPVGSVILPLIFILIRSNFFIAWAKPVPFNPYRLRDYQYGPMKVALAGPAANAALAVLFGLTARWLPLELNTKIDLVVGFFGADASVLNVLNGSFVGWLFVLAIAFCGVNLALMVFNLIPWPPLDGSKVLYAFLPEKGRQAYMMIESNFLLLMLLLFALLYLGVIDVIFSYTVFPLFSLLVGL